MSEDLITLLFGIFVGVWFMWTGIAIYEYCTSKQECKSFDNVTICRDVYTKIVRNPYVVGNINLKEVEW